MIPESASFDGDSIEVSFPPNPTPTSDWWWNAATKHNYAYHPELTSLRLLVEHATKGYRLSRAQRKNLAKLIKPKPCGSGTLVEVEDSMLRRAGGRLRAGGKHSVFLLSPRGRLGTLVVGTSIYHKYSLQRIHVGTLREFNWLPELSSEPCEVETFTFGSQTNR